MQSRFRLKLMIIMIAFALSISAIIAVIDHNRLKSQTIQNQQSQMQKSEELVISSIETIEKAYHVFGEHIAVAMKDVTAELMNLYSRQADFEQWDFEKLKQQYGFDIYIINDTNVIDYSSMKADIGLNFNSCCKGLTKTLNERRLSGEFYHDGIDIEQQTGFLKKYSYMGTPDKKYLIQLGDNLQGGDIFQQFNFFTAINKLKEQDPVISEIHILNTIGLALGHNPDESTSLTDEHREAFKHTLATKQTTELQGEWNGEKAYYRYIYYESDYDTGTTTERKVLQIIYNDKELRDILAENRQTFILQLLTVLCVTIILSLFISKAVARPMHLAFHDSLTGLKNRAAFEEAMLQTLSSQRTMTALIMMDVDNFKQVNDHSGHDTGDQLLRCVAAGIQMAARKQDIPARLGGDEFMMIMPESNEKEAVHMAEQLIASINHTIASNEELTDSPVTISIGVAFSPHHGEDAETLIKHADEALYSSKEYGKNQYQIYKG